MRDLLLKPCGAHAGSRQWQDYSVHQAGFIGNIVGVVLVLVLVFLRCALTASLVGLAAPLASSRPSLAPVLCITAGRCILRLPSGIPSDIWQPRVGRARCPGPLLPTFRRCVIPIGGRIPGCPSLTT